ncbi:hypothetical protein HG536_0A02420 [Torulaspora globosa]|uniref:holo-[acyl-carrier-protein] synthase n=1 Tax=Torulaspora globosa TaxID=48254 RepID=A0A7G3ZA89_9SACH|nr:uncharacterized protein HG536_0A02420 [Torulaspora globosa]QLL30425.1 hypothetical protein HG536_0A02420 [Torulaspora globosa]
MDDLASIRKLDRDWEGILALDVKHANLTDDFTFERAIRFLPLSQQAKIYQLRTLQGKYAAVCNRLLQLFGCSIASGIGFGEVEFEHSSYGKPRMKNCPQISFSMSNGQDYVVQYICRRNDGDPAELGVDIASRDDYLGGHDLETFCEVFSDTEYKHLQSLDDGMRRKAFAFYWSLKECYSKYTGLGLNCDLSKLDYGGMQVPEVGSGSQRLIDNDSMLFYSVWIPRHGKEIVTVCRQDDLKEPALSRWLKSGPPVYRITLEDILGFLEAGDARRP